MGWCRTSMLAIACLLAACGGGSGAAAVDAGAGTAPIDGGRGIVVVTFNTGTTLGLRHDEPPDDGYTSAMAAISDEHYGDGLAWPPAIEAARAFVEVHRPDVVALQEIFDPAECAAIPVELHAGFVCEAWSPGDPTVAQQVLGPDYQIACNLEHADKCLGVRRSFGTIRGCGADLCRDGLDGAEIAGCGSGSRVGRARIDLAGGGEITVVAVHGSSGIADDEEACRVAQLEQAFALADGERNVILGDLNTDPGRFAAGDPSAQLLLDRTADGEPFRFVTEIGPRVTPTYGGIVNIDHVIADALAGTCWAAGVSEGHAPVIDATYFDHRPIVCSLAP